MYQITARGSRADIEAAFETLAWSDPSPASAVDSKEDGRFAWRLDAYADSEEDAQACIDLMAEAAPALNPQTSPLQDRDWVALSLEGLPPVCARHFVVAGSHALAASSPGKTAILIEAGPAFGTGHHGTTLGRLLAYAHILKSTRPRKVLDVGTGSGVLAIAAVKSQARHVLGTEIDAVSVRVANENAAKNRCGRRFTALAASGATSTRVARLAPYDLIFANILSRPLIQLAPTLTRQIKPGGHIILSGLLTVQEPLVRAAYLGRNFSLIKRIHRDGWSTLVFRRQLAKAL